MEPSRNENPPQASIRHGSQSRREFLCHGGRGERRSAGSRAAADSAGTWVGRYVAARIGRCSALTDRFEVVYAVSDRRELLRLLSVGGVLVALPRNPAATEPGRIARAGDPADIGQHVLLNAHLWQVFALA